MQGAIKSDKLARPMLALDGMISIGMRRCCAHQLLAFLRVEDALHTCRKKTAAFIMLTFHTKFDDLPRARLRINAWKSKRLPLSAPDTLRNAAALAAFWAMEPSDSIAVMTALQLISPHPHRNHGTTAPPHTYEAMSERKVRVLQTYWLLCVVRCGDVPAALLTVVDSPPILRSAMGGRALRSGPTPARP